MKLRLACFAALAALGLAATAHAEVVDWTLSNGTFSDGGAFSGTFDLDTSDDAITNFDIVTSGDSFFFPSTTYSPAKSVFPSTATTAAGYPQFRSPFIFFNNTLSLTDIPVTSGGTVTSLTGSECCSLLGGGSRNITGGTAVGTVEGGGVSAAPEPSTWALMIAGVGAIGLAFRQAGRKIGFTGTLAT